MTVDSPKSIIIVANLLNRKGYNVVTELPKFTNKDYSCYFEKLFKRDLNRFYSQHEQDLRNKYKLPSNFILRIRAYVAKHIHKDQYCEFDNVYGYIKLIKLFKERFYYYDS